MKVTLRSVSITLKIVTSAVQIKKTGIPFNLHFIIISS